MFLMKRYTSLASAYFLLQLRHLLGAMPKTFHKMGKNIGAMSNGVCTNITIL